MASKYYDFDKAKSLIESKKEEIESASLGMHEDWFWTAQTIWENGEYKQPILSNAEAKEMDEIYIKKRKEGVSILSGELDEYQKHMIGGIWASHWATPTLQLVYKNGEDEMIECSFGEQEISEEEKLQKQLEWASGALSKPVQENITPLKTN